MLLRLVRSRLMMSAFLFTATLFAARSMMDESCAYCQLQQIARIHTTAAG